MVEHGEDVFYYLTVTNENYPQRSLPSNVESGVIRGMYRMEVHEGVSARGRVRLLGSGAILREVIAAGELLAQDWQVSCEVWSVTSFSELAREAREIERWNRLHPLEISRRSYLSECIGGADPVIACTDYVRAYPQLIASYVAATFIALGTDGFGRSDTRSALRRFFEIDRYQIVLAALQGLEGEGLVSSEMRARAIERYGIDSDAAASWVR
jgi:pyruvate dehydrogenase E1 component